MFVFWLFDLILYIPQSCRDGSSSVEPVLYRREIKCLSQGHNVVPLLTKLVVNHGGFS